MFDSIGALELMTVGVVALVVYGRDLPRAARDAGKFIGNMKRTLGNLQDDLRRQIDTSIEEETRPKADSAAAPPAAALPVPAPIPTAPSPIDPPATASSVEPPAV